MCYNLWKPLTICNIHHPPHDNSSNDKISKFLWELSQVLDILQKENTHAAVVSDFNIDLLQINGYEKFFDLMCSNSFYLIAYEKHFPRTTCGIQ